MPMKTILVFAPHPDDAEFFAGGTISKFAAQGDKIIIVVVTDGRKASFHIAAETLRIQRRTEAYQAAEIMGVSSLEFLDFPDLELDLLPSGTLRERFVFLIRQHRPDAIIAEDVLAAGEVHPDHRAVALAVSDAVSFSHLPLVYPEQMASGVSPHFVVEKYFYSDDITRSNKVVDISTTFELKIEAVGAHASQVEFLVEEILMQARLAALDIGAILGDAAGDSLAVIRWAMHTQAGEIGKQAGYEYGEAFRYVRFHPYIEGVLKYKPFCLDNYV